MFVINQWLDTSVQWNLIKSKMKNQLKCFKHQFMTFTWHLNKLARWTCFLSFSFLFFLSSKRVLHSISEYFTLQACALVFMSLFHIHKLSASVLKPDFTGIYIMFFSNIIIGILPLQLVMSLYLSNLQDLRGIRVQIMHHSKICIICWWLEINGNNTRQKFAL